jgi:hypothetical protein
LDAAAEKPSAAAVDELVQVEQEHCDSKTCSSLASGRRLEQQRPKKSAGVKSERAMNPRSYIALGLHLPPITADSHLPENRNNLINSLKCLKQRQNL